MTEVAELLEVCEYILGNLPINSAHDIADLELKLPDIINRAKKEFDEMNARVSELERLLRMVEFGGEWDIQWCMWCHQMSNCNRPEDIKHKPDCPRQKALGE